MAIEIVVYIKYLAHHVTHIIYVGQTGASLETRVSQHKGYVRLGDGNKAIFLHIKIPTIV